MKKELSEMTLEELWELFPIILSPHNDCWLQWYEDEKARINSYIDLSNMRFSHIGSTAIKDIAAKPTVDILLEIPMDTKMDFVAHLLTDCGYRLINEESDRKDFNRGYTPEGYADRVFHLHLRLFGDNNELYFRDYLNDNEEARKEYERLKLSLWKKYEHNRDDYTAAKSAFVKKYTAAAKILYSGRY